MTINVGEVSKHVAPPRTHFERALEIRDSLKFHIDLDGVGKDATLMRLSAYNWPPGPTIFAVVAMGWSTLGAVYSHKLFLPSLRARHSWG